MNHTPADPKRSEPAPPPHGYATEDLARVQTQGTAAEPDQEAFQPLEKALDVELIRLERVVSTAGAIVSAGGVGLSLLTGFLVSWPLGISLLVLASFYLSWYSAARRLLKRARYARLLLIANPIIEGLLPGAVILIDTFAMGPTYALGQAVPIQLIGIVTILAILRLNPRIPIVVSTLAGVEYLTIYTLLWYPVLPAAVLEQPAHSPVMALIRSVMMVLGGVAASFVSRGLRRAAHQAAGEVRSKELFGKYRLGSQIAAGGMGVVFHATYCPEGGFRRPVALKRVHPELAKNHEFVARFRYEAELCSKMVHPNIVQVLDFGKVDDTYFITMEFVDGCTLLELIHRAIERGKLPPPGIVAQLGRELCQGLAFAHREARDDEGGLLRVIHRDLSPPNVLVARSGQIKILDFGIARATGEAGRLVTRHVSGKLAYMAPEQVMGQTIDERVDLFAAAVILWELLACRPLFEAATEAELLSKVIYAPVTPIEELRPDLVGTGWPDFFRTGLARGATERFQNAYEMLETLTSLLHASGPLAPDAVSSYVIDLLSTPARSALLHSAPTVDETRQSTRTIVSRPPPPTRSELKTRT